jgi:hypothetical protein
MQRLALLLLVCGCDRVLAIEEATVDPQLTSSQDPCDAYCDAVLDNCSGKDAVYSTRDVCLGVCQNLPRGEPGATSGNSLACRQHAAELASAEADFYCPIAGPGGNGICGDDCESLCQLVDAVCSDFGDTSSCLDECGALQDLGTFSVDPAADQGHGGHVQCRLYHVSVATLEPDRHCTHALGAGPCN